jgi:hypothetical protein
VPDHCRQAIFLSGSGTEVTVLGIPHHPSPPLQLPGDARDDSPQQRLEFRRCGWRHAPEARPNGGQLIDAVEDQCRLGPPLNQQQRAGDAVVTNATIDDLRDRDAV